MADPEIRIVELELDPSGTPYAGGIGQEGAPHVVNRGSSLGAERIAEHVYFDAAYDYILAQNTTHAKTNLAWTRMMASRISKHADLRAAITSAYRAAEKGTQKT